MFKKLFSLRPGAKSDHPLGSDVNVDALIAGIPLGDPARTLLELDQWHDDIQRFEPEIGLRAVMRASLRLDAVADVARNALLARYLDVKAREHLSEVVLADIERSVKQAIAAYQYALATQHERKGDDIAKADIELAAARAMRLLVVQKKLQRFRYRAPGASQWRDMLALLALTGQLAAANTAVTTYEGAGIKRTVVQHFLAGIYAELAPLGNLLPQQVEILDRMLLQVADTLEFASEPRTGSSHWIDLAGAGGPVPMDKAAPPSPAVRYLGQGRLRPVIMRIAGELRSKDAPLDWLLPAGVTPALAQQLLAVVLLHWTGPPPKRGAERQASEDKLRVVLGFALARRMVAFSDFARSGRSLNYDGTKVDALFTEYRFGGSANEALKKSATPAEPEIVNPIDVLERLETSGDKQMMELWIQADQSETGLGATPRALLPRHRVGGLVCLRYHDGLEWHLGLIRRIGRTAEGIGSIGLELLPWPSTSAHVKPLGGETTVWNKIEEAGHGYLDAILVSSDGDQLVLPKGAYVADLVLDIRTSEGTRRARLSQLIESGEDHDRVRFTLID